MNITPDLIGKRVTLRTLTGGVGPTGGPEMTDAIGVVRSISDTEIELENRHGDLVVASLRHVVALRVVPDLPLRG